MLVRAIHRSGTRERFVRPDESLTASATSPFPAPLKFRVVLFFAAAIALLGSACTRKAGQVWLTDLTAAKTQAAKEGKHLLVEFTGSAWCPPCVELHARILTSPEFAAFSQNVVLVVLDYPPDQEWTPEKIRAEPKLAALMALKHDYGVAALPTVILFDAQDREVGRMLGYGGENPKAYLGRLSARDPHPPM